MPDLSLMGKTLASMVELLQKCLVAVAPPGCGPARSAFRPDSDVVRCPDVAGTRERHRDRHERVETRESLPVDLGVAQPDLFADDQPAVDESFGTAHRIAL